MTRTLSEAIQARIDEAREAARKRAEEEARRIAELEEQEQFVARLFNDKICRMYDLEPGSIEFKALWRNNGTFELRARVGDGLVALNNSVRLEDGAVHIEGLGPISGHEWKTVHGKYYHNCLNLIDAIIYAINGAGAETLAGQEGTDEAPR